MTGQAFEDMQEQNLRLMQQLREKDDANFKLMGEKIKSNQVHKLLREEKQVSTIAIQKFPILKLFYTRWSKIRKRNEEVLIYSLGVARASDDDTQPVVGAKRCRP